MYVQAHCAGVTNNITLHVHDVYNIYVPAYMYTVIAKETAKAFHRVHVVMIKYLKGTKTDNHWDR
jgi:hypothetical protein